MEERIIAKWLTILKKTSIYFSMSQTNPMYKMTDLRFCSPKILRGSTGTSKSTGTSIQKNRSNEGIDCHKIGFSLSLLSQFVIQNLKKIRASLGPLKIKDCVPRSTRNRQELAYQIRSPNRRKTVCRKIDY